MSHFQSVQLQWHFFIFVFINIRCFNNFIYKKVTADVTDAYISDHLIPKLFLFIHSG